MLPAKLCFVDIETTGGSITYDRIIEIGIVRVENGKVVKKLTSLIDPGCYLPPEITSLTGIASSDLEGAPTFRQIAGEIAEILEDAVFVAHNVRFDYSFLKQEFKRIRKEFSPKNLCTVKLSRALYPRFRHHNLDSIIERHNFKIKRRHRAFDDAYILYQFYKRVKKELGEEKLLAAVQRVMKLPALPIGLSKEILDSLPEKCGVYIFYGENGLPLYVGKSVNIRNRVMNHFSSDHSSPFELKIAQQIKSIETIICQGELGALIKESQLVKDMQPLYNRKLRVSKRMILLKHSTDENGYSVVQLEEASSIEIEDLNKILGVHKTRRQAKEFLLMKAKEHGLCEKLLGADKTLKECFGYRLGRCKGACKGKEDYFEYNQRFLEAFSNNRISEWPFSAPILIEEKDELEEKAAGFLIDRWCYLGKMEYNDGDISTSLENDIAFDLDTYKIIKSFINSPKNKRKIKQLNPFEFQNLIKI